MKLDRNQRQDLSVQKWLDNKGRGLAILPTGFGKTRVAMKIISRFKDKHPTFRAIVIVPSDYLKIQWTKELTQFGIEDVTDVYIVNTAITLKDTKCNLLIADEVHMFCSVNFITVFDVIRHTYFLGLSATLERLDHKEKLLLAKYSIVDNVSLEEAIKSKWVSPFKQYKVELNVDLTEYIEANTGFLHHFSFFGHDFELAMSCAKYRPVRLKLQSYTGQSEKDIMLHAMQFMRYMGKRKKFIYDHPKKIELANKIINSRTNSKIITFTKHVHHAKEVCCGTIYHSGLTKRKKDEVILEFNELTYGVLNTCKALDVGADIQGVDLGIIMSGDSSNISKKQKIGRAIRFAEDKVAEIFTFVVKGTAEEAWFQKSNKTLEYTTIQDHQLDDLLDGKELKDSDQNDEFIFLL